MQLEVYERYAKRVFATCVRLLKDVHEAEDVMQETFIQAFDKIDRFRGDSELGTWICRIGINKSLDRLKKRKIPLVFDDSLAFRAEGIADSENDTYDIDRIKQALNQLPNGCKLIFEMRMIDEMDYPLIAETLGMKEASVRVQYARARSKIIELVKETYV